MADSLQGLFITADYASEERYDLAKFLDFKGDGYDALNSPFLLGLKKLSLWRYYKVDEGYKDIDLIAYDAYGSMFYAFLIQFYNDTIDEVFPEGTVLNLFNIEDLEDLYNNLLNNNLSGLS